MHATKATDGIGDHRQRDFASSSPRRRLDARNVGHRSGHRQQQVGVSLVVATMVLQLLATARMAEGAGGGRGGEQQRSQSADASVRLNQGIVTGLKVFPESSRTPVYSYLGIPYAQPPMGALRFAPPKPHSGWNRTLYARNYQAICPQPERNTYEESSSGYPYQSRMSENCLYLNVWTPEGCLRFGRCAILAIITGEEQAFDWARNRPSGLDLAAEGLVVVTIQSRANIFGWLTTGDADAPGNLGLRDQQLALRWIQANGAGFGGDAQQVTLLGHGTSGGANVMMHLTNVQSSALFTKLIAMSGTVFSPWSFQVTRNAASTSLSAIRSLGCESTQSALILQCVRGKSVVELLQAFEKIHQRGNYTRLLGPEVDRYLAGEDVAERWLLRDPRTVLAEGDYQRKPMLLGICSNEGAFLREQWLELGRQSYEMLYAYVQNTLIPNALHMYGFRGGGQQLGLDSVRDAINWRYFEQIPRSVPALLDAMQRFQSEVWFERPFYETIEVLSRRRDSRVPTAGVTASALVAQLDEAGVPSFREDPGIMEHRALVFDGDDANESNRLKNTKSGDSPEAAALYVYSFQQPGTIDLRGRPNYFGGAGHSADLLFLMGPSLYKQIGRRKLSVGEERLCARMRQTFADFVRTGNPTPGRLFDAWHPYSRGHRYVQVLGAPDSVAGASLVADNHLWSHRVAIDEMLSSSGMPPQADEVTVSSAGIALASPYAIGQRKSDVSGWRYSKSSYLPDGEPVDSAYAMQMSRVSSFWSELLPRMYGQQRGPSGRQLDEAEVGAEVSSASSEQVAKFRHAFFAMLSLVCVLLAMLGVCVYMLRRGNRGGHIDTSYL